MELIELPKSNARMNFLIIFLSIIFSTSAKAQENLTRPNSQPAQNNLETQSNAGGFYANLVNAAKERTKHFVIYDGSYQAIAYPGGDVKPNRGVCTDVVIRSYRALDIDLQKALHEDIREHFSLYPSKKMWGLTKPDRNIDHRRVPNLQVFFARKGKSLPITSNPVDYIPGDIVTWMLAGELPHIGIVVDTESHDGIRRQVVHNIGSGPKMDDMLFDFKITGHYRYRPTL